MPEARSKSIVLIALSLVSLIALSLVSFVLAYAMSMALANMLGPAGYDDYAVAIGSLVMLSTFAEAGTGKYSLSAWPKMVARREWGHASGFWRFAALLVLASSLLLAAAVSGGEAAEDGRFANYALGEAALFLPVIALAGMGAELVTATGAAVRAAIITRVIIPGVSLFLTLAWWLVGRELAAPDATAIYASGWIVGLVALGSMFARNAGRDALRSPPAWSLRPWLRGSLSFLGLALLVSMLAKVGLVVLEASTLAESELGVYAICLETGAFVFVLAKSTDKLFLPRVSELLESGEIEPIRALLRQRNLLIAGISAAFLVGLWVWGRPLLGLFGEEFEHGHRAMMIIAAATSCWTFASLSAWLLAFLRGTKLAILTHGIAVALLIVATAVLAEGHGIEGAALAYAIPIVGLSLISLLLSRRALARHASTRAAGASQPEPPATQTS
jgi:O-antigen/teichoic acid export membrane protein